MLDVLGLYLALEVGENPIDGLEYLFEGDGVHQFDLAWQVVLIDDLLIEDV